MKFRGFLRKVKIPTWLVWLGLSVLFGTAMYLLMYGRFRLYFGHVNWIYSIGRDPLQHQLGWEFFRNEPWKFPLGSIESYGYPIGTSIFYLDSIPLFAFFFKLFSPWLGSQFQYFGIWELANLIGQIFVGILILNEFSRSKGVNTLGGVLLALSPIMINRAFFHSSLSAHWIILLAIWFIILEWRGKMRRWFWFALFGLAMLVHLYYIPMLIPLWLIGSIFRVKNEHKIGRVFLELLVIIIICCGIGFCLGMFEIGFSQLSEKGFGDYSWNLNGFVNSMGNSIFFKALPLAGEDQGEGFSYLGAGYIGILLVGAFLFFIKANSRKNWKLFLPFMLVAIGFGLFALSNKAFFGENPLWSIDLSAGIQTVANTFRSSARFIWPVFYFLVLFGLISVVRNGQRIAIPLLLVAIAAQAYDLHPLYAQKRSAGFEEYYAGGMRSEFWQLAAETNRHIVIIPTEYYEHIVLYGAHHNMTVNSGYFGRADYQAMEDLATKTWDDLRNGTADQNTLYILSETEYMTTAREQLAEKMYVCEIDDYVVLFSKESALVHKGFNFLDHCKFPGN